MRCFTLIVAMCLTLATSANAQTVDRDNGAMQRVSALLSAYAKKDVPAVMNMLDPNAAMYGQRASEFFSTPAEIRTLLASDYAGWNTSKFGTPQHVTIRSSNDLQAVFFDVPFSIVTRDGHAAAFTVRFATVWHHSGDRWLLVQSMNTTV